MKTEVRQVAVPQAALRRSTLRSVDYADAFLVRPGIGGDQTPEDWARALFANAPGSLRTALPRGWTSLGLKIGSPESDEFILGWTVRRSTSDYVLLGAESRIGMPAELLFMRHAGATLFSTLVAHRNPLVRALWAAITPGHVRVVRRLLETAPAAPRSALRAAA